MIIHTECISKTETIISVEFSDDICTPDLLPYQYFTDILPTLNVVLSQCGYAAIKPAGEMVAWAWEEVEREDARMLLRHYLMTGQAYGTALRDNDETDQIIRAFFNTNGQEIYFSNNDVYRDGEGRPRFDPQVSAGVTNSTFEFGLLALRCRSMKLLISTDED